MLAARHTCQPPMARTQRLRAGRVCVAGGDVGADEAASCNRPISIRGG